MAEEAGQRLRASSQECRRTLQRHGSTPSTPFTTVCDSSPKDLTFSFCLCRSWTCKGQNVHLGKLYTHKISISKIKRGIQSVHTVLLTARSRHSDPSEFVTWLHVMYTWSHAAITSHVPCSTAYGGIREKQSRKLSAPVMRISSSYSRNNELREKNMIMQRTFFGFAESACPDSAKPKNLSHFNILQVIILTTHS